MGFDTDHIVGVHGDFIFVIALSTINSQPSTVSGLLCDADVFGFCEEDRLRRAAFASLRRAKGYGAAGAALHSTIYFAMQMFFASVKNRKASSPPSRPTPLAFMPPKGTRRSRTSQRFNPDLPSPPRHIQSVISGTILRLPCACLQKA